ncbi:GIY-YIG nuclease family protein [Pseudomonas protegens]|uniref:GIY-YIG nuclease family protein n=1 Tax=Pseudomonas protegens TaxID=380021 RepID=UPI0038508A6F
MSSTYGFIYIMGCEAMPGVYKVGMTAYSPRRRAIELSRGTGVPAEYQVLFYGEHDNALAWEQLVHTALADRRVSENREFFRGPLADIIRTISGDGELLSEWLSDESKEALAPGCMSSQHPLWFEQNLHSPGYIERARRGRL